MSPPPKAQDSRALLTFCAMALASAVGAHASGYESRAVEKLERYCSASWRNAGIRRDEWEDCTQQALVELLEQVDRDGLPRAIDEADSEQRRELNRAVWRLVQRSRRAPHLKSFDETRMPPGEQHRQAAEQEGWDEIAAAAEQVLSPRQCQVLDLTRQGWRVAEIAEHLHLSPERVSDEKYKAIAKLRERLVS